MKSLFEQKRIHCSAYKSSPSVHFSWMKRTELDVAESLIGGGKKPAGFLAR